MPATCLMCSLKYAVSSSSLITSDVKSTGVRPCLPGTVDTVVSLSFHALASTDGDSYLPSLAYGLSPYSPDFINLFSPFLMEGNDLSRASFHLSNSRFELFHHFSCLCSSLTQSALECSAVKSWLVLAGVIILDMLWPTRLFHHQLSFVIPLICEIGDCLYAANGLRWFLSLDSYIDPLIFFHEGSLMIHHQLLHDLQCQESCFHFSLESLRIWVELKSLGSGGPRHMRRMWGMFFRSSTHWLRSFPPEAFDSGRPKPIDALRSLAFPNLPLLFDLLPIRASCLESLAYLRLVVCGGNFLGL